MSEITLNIARTITPPDWASSDSACAVMSALGEGNALFVGGCVRNELLGAPVSDVDIACKLAPDAILERLKLAGIKTVPTGIDHGTITAVVECGRKTEARDSSQECRAEANHGHQRSYEITSLRKDIETDGRRAVVAFTDDWREDAMRRDFTMNTLLMDIRGNIYDSLGQGLSDLEARCVKFVGDPAQRIAEDVLRILRFFRFHAFYGAGEMDVAALKACAEAAHKIPELSSERISQEFYKILSIPNPAEILSVMAGCGVLVDILVPSPSFAKASLSSPRGGEGGDKFSILSGLCHFQAQYNAFSLSARLLCLAGDDAFERLIITRAMKKEIAAIDAAYQSGDLSDEHTLKTAIYRHGNDTAAQACLLQSAIRGAFEDSIMELAQSWLPPEFPVRAETLMAQGLSGAELGKALRSLETRWLENGFSLPDAALLQGK